MLSYWVDNGCTLIHSVNLIMSSRVADIIPDDKIPQDKIPGTKSQATKSHMTKSLRTKSQTTKTQKTKSLKTKSQKRRQNLRRKNPRKRRQNPRQNPDKIPVKPDNIAEKHYCVHFQIFSPEITRMRVAIIRTLNLRSNTSSGLYNH